jgi:triacylglycerol esterase/lipase EstA (alpha/beta hydrolase family)
MKKGGLDGRYLLSVIQPWEYTIVSLTTIATPHHGSSFMDWCKERLGVGHFYDPVKPRGWKSVMEKIDAPAFANLTTDYCQHTFNPQTPNVKHVVYSSYAAVSEFKHLSPLYFPHQIIRDREGKNDGLVSLTSAQWGNFLGTLDCDHWELVPSSLLYRRQFDPVEFYLTLVTQLYDYGF